MHPRQYQYELQGKNKYTAQNFFKSLINCLLPQLLAALGSSAISLVAIGLLVRLRPASAKHGFLQREPPKKITESPHPFRNYLISNISFTIPTDRQLSHHLFDRFSRCGNFSAVHMYFSCIRRLKL